MTGVDWISICCPWFYPAVVFIVGLCVGSFLNVCIYRMPRGLSIVWPGSFCPKSGAPLKAWENIPVLSFLFLQGRGSVSRAPISWQYPIVELLTACVFLALWLSFSAPVAIALMVMAGIFIAGSFIDWQFKIIPDTMTVGGTAAGLLASALVPALHGVAGEGMAATMHALGVSLQGMLIGSAIVLWMAILGELALKKEAMGFGDVKLLGMIGAFLGWPGAVFSIFGGAFVGIAVAGGMILAEKLTGKEGRFFGREIPFGPMLCTAALAYVWLKPALLGHWEAVGRVLGM